MGRDFVSLVPVASGICAYWHVEDARSWNWGCDVDVEDLGRERCMGAGPSVSCFSGFRNQRDISLQSLPKRILRTNLVFVICLSFGVTAIILLASFTFLTPSQYGTLAAGISFFGVVLSVVLWAYGRTRGRGSR